MNKLTFAAIFLVLFSACGTVKQLSELSYKDKRTFDHYYLEASKQKLLNNTERSIALFHEALDVYPNSHAVHYQLGALHYQKEEYITAEEHSRKANDLNAGYNHWYAGQHAQVLNKLGRFDESAKVFEHMIVQEEDNQQLYMEAVNQYLNASNPRMAVDVLNRLEEQIGITEESATRKEYIYLRVGKFKEAVESIQRLVDAHPEQLIYRGFLAETLISTGQKDKALKVLEELSIADSSLGRTEQLLYQLYSEKGEYFKSYKHAKRAFRANDIPIGDKLKMFTPFFLKINMNGISKTHALELSDILLELYPTQDVPYIVKGDIYNALDSLHISRKYFLKAVTMTGSDYRTWDKLLSIDSKLGELQWQVEDSDKAIESFPNIPGFYLSKAFALYDLERFKEAISTSDEGLDIAIDKRDKVDLLSVKALAYDKLGQSSLSDENYRHALSIDSANMLIMNNYAYALAERGEQLEEALKLAEKIVEAEPSNPFYLDTKAWVLHKLGRSSEAIPLLEKAIVYDPKGVEYYEHLYEIYLSLGEEGKAVDALERAVELGSDLGGKEQ